MKHIFKLILVVTLVISPFSQADDEVRDFGIRVSGGVLQGIDKQIIKEFSAYADMYLLSQSLRLVFGFGLYEMGKTQAPTMSIQSIGIEQNFPVGRGDIFLGALYSKAYLKNENSGFDPQRGMSFQTGYKYPIKRHQEFVLTIGQQFQPLKIENNSLGSELDEKTVYFRLGSEWYF